MPSATAMRASVMEDMLAWAASGLLLPVGWVVGGLAIGILLGFR